MDLPANSTVPLTAEGDEQAPPVVIASGDTTPSGRPRHLESLTGLRIFAALAVYTAHVTPLKGAPTWLASLMAAGYAGVTIFFVLSGFVLGINYWDRLHTAGDIWRYLVARLARVYPVYLLVLTWPVVTLVNTHALHPGDLLVHTFALQAWDTNALTADNFVGPAWSISVEFFLYLCLPVILPLLRLVDRRLWRTVAVMVITATGMVALAVWFRHTGHDAVPVTEASSSHYWLYQIPLTRLGDFVLGVMACRLYVRLHTRIPDWSGWPLIVLPLVVLTLLAADHAFLNTALSWDAGYALPGVVLIFGLAAAPSNPISRLLSLRPIVFLGECSYAFYLAHTFVIEYTTGSVNWTNEVTVGTILQQVETLGAALIIAVGLHVAVERPARVWLRRKLAPTHVSAWGMVAALTRSPSRQLDRVAVVDPPPAPVADEATPETEQPERA